MSSYLLVTGEAPFEGHDTIQKGWLMHLSRFKSLLALLLALGLIAAACSGDDSDDTEAGGSGDSELDEALETFDGEILAERAVIAARTNEQAGQSGSGQNQGQGGGSELPADRKPRYASRATSLSCTCRASAIPLDSPVA